MDDCRRRSARRSRHHLPLTTCPLPVQVLDLFSACALLTALAQFSYAILIGSFPFNAFLAGFFCCIGSFVLTGECGAMAVPTSK